MADQSSVRKPMPMPEVKPEAPSRADPSFDGWLDVRLKSMYDSVLNEQLPDEILKLLEQPKSR